MTTRLAALLAFILLPALAAHADTAFVGVHVVPMDRERVIENQTVVVADGRIAEIGPAGKVDIPEGATRVDAKGAYLMPGIAEMHAHIPGRFGTGEWPKDVLYLYVANGITTARGMLGQPWHLKLREQVANHEILGPRIYTSGPSLNGNSVDGPEAGRRMVREQAEAGYDFLKIHPGLSMAEYNAIAETANELGIPFAGHVPADVGLTRTLESGQATIDHLDGYMEMLVPEDTPQPENAFVFGIGLTGVADPDRIPAIAKDIERSGMWNVPTQVLLEKMTLPVTAQALAAEPEMQYVPRDMLAGWQRRKKETMSAPGYDALVAEQFIDYRRRMILALHEADARLLLGSDAPQLFQVPGFAMHGELDSIVASGLTPYEVLRHGTVNPAVFFDAENEFGMVKEGLAADLILLDTNPLESVTALRKPRGVMVRGRWLSRDELDAGLADIAKRNGGS